MTATAAPVQRRPWWLTLILGIIAAALGAVLLWAPAKQRVETYTLLIAILGVYWLIWGVLEIVAMFHDHRSWGWKLAMGIISILAGGYILLYPIAAGVVVPRAFVLLLGLWGLVEGVVLLLMAFRGGGWGLGILGVVAIIFGLILIANYAVPGSGLVMIWATAVAALVGGVILIIQAFVHRKA
jgi:uncharacterized membrane protein HdeD (DUF308 family)